MKTIIELLQKNPEVSDYKITSISKESWELFFVKGKLETLRHTDTCDQEVTVYADHGVFKGDAQFFVYPYTTAEQLEASIADAVAKAKLIQNQHYNLPEGGVGEYSVPSNFREYDMPELATIIADTVFEANDMENGSLNSVEIFITKQTLTVCNSRSLHKTQVRYTAMVEAIPTYNGAKQSVELYEQYNFGHLDIPALRDQIRSKMAEVKARYEASPAQLPEGIPVILNKLELSQLFTELSYDLNYASVYSHANLYSKGDAIQKKPEGDLLTVTLAGQIPGSVNSSMFDGDGLDLGSCCIIRDGKVCSYFGDNRFGQYLGEPPTGSLRCIQVEAGSATADAFCQGLEIISMSGLQVDAYNDYIGGEVRLAYWHNGTETVPVTGISISGKLSQVLDHIRLSQETALHGGYLGPAKAVLSHMNIY